MAVTALMERTESQPRTALPTNPTQPTQPIYWTINSSSKSVDRNATNQTGHQPYRFTFLPTLFRVISHTQRVSFDPKIKRKANGRQKKKR